MIKDKERIERNGDIIDNVCCNTYGFMYNFWPYLLSYTIIFDSGAATSDFTYITGRAQCLASLHSPVK